MDLLDSIRLFRRLAETKSFSKVATELGISQPTVTKTIAALEKSLGVQLVRRSSSRALTLTAAGERLRTSGGPALEVWDSLVAAVRNEAVDLKGPLRINASLGFARLVLAPILDDFAAQHPHLRLGFVLSDVNVDLVANGIDLAIRHGEQEDSALSAIKVGSWKRALFATPAYLEKRGRPGTIDDLASHRLLYHSQAGEPPAWIFNEVDGKERRFAFTPHFQSDGSELVRELVTQGSGIGLLPTWMMTKAMERGEVVRMFDEHCRELVPIYLVRAGTQEPTAKQRVMAEFLRERFDDCSCLAIQKEARFVASSSAAVH